MVVEAQNFRDLEFPWSERDYGHESKYKKGFMG